MIAGNYFAAAMALPKSQQRQARIFNKGSNMHGCELSQDGQFWKINYRNFAEFYVPRPVDAVRLVQDGGYGRVYSKYCAYPEVSVCRDTTIIDIGAYLGEFSWALPESSHVIAIEPDERSAECLSRNVGDHVEVMNVAAWNETTTLEFELGDDGSESSLLGTDDNAPRETTQVQAHRVAELTDRDVDLLKVEAEGAEPEALEGAIDLEPTQIVVDVSEERNGENTADLVTTILESNDYTTSKKADVAIGVQHSGRSA